MSSCISRDISPRKVASPTLSTFISTSPDRTTHPRKTAEGDEGVREVSALRYFSISLLSPVIEDWSTVMRPDSTYPSAGICSPAPTSSISPTTISSIGISDILPSRRALKFAREHSSESRINADSPPRSDTVEINVARNTDIAIPTVSITSPPRKTNIRFTANAQRSIFITGSPRLEIKCAKKPFRGRTLRTLAPCSAREAATSADESPRPFF